MVVFVEYVHTNIQFNIREMLMTTLRVKVYKQE